MRSQSEKLEECWIPAKQSLKALAIFCLPNEHEELETELCVVFSIIQCEHEWQPKRNIRPEEEIKKTK